MDMERHGVNLKARTFSLASPLELWVKVGIELVQFSAV